MAIKFFNVKSKEVRIAETEPQIAALWGTSDRGPNATIGQDMGWRLAPEVVVEMKKISQNPQVIAHIAAMTNKMAQDINESDLLEYISAQTTPENAPVASDEDFTDEYNAEIRRLSQEDERLVSASLKPMQSASQIKTLRLKKKKLREKRLKNLTSSVQIKCFN